MPGVFSPIRIARFPKSPITLNTRLSTRNVISAVETDVFIFRYSPAPRYWEVITLAPIPPPMAIMINTVVSE